MYLVHELYRRIMETAKNIGINTSTLTEERRFIDNLNSLANMLKQELNKGSPNLNQENLEIVYNSCINFLPILTKITLHQALELNELNYIANVFYGYYRDYYLNQEKSLVNQLLPVNKIIKNSQDFNQVLTALKKLSADHEHIAYCEELMRYYQFINPEPKRFRFFIASREEREVKDCQIVVAY